MKVKFEIAQPWPEIRRLAPERMARRAAAGAPKIEVRYSWAPWWKPWAGWRQFWVIGSLELYWPAMVTVWVHDTQRKGPAPKGGGWKVTFPLGRKIRRYLLTRCEWCHGPSRKGDRVNCLGGSVRHEERERRWWKGESDLYHQDCSSIAHARKVCICGPTGGPWEHELSNYPYGRCATCGKYRGWLSPDNHRPEYPGLHSDRLLAAIPDGQRDPATMAIVRGMWKHWRALQEAGE